jgi:hypothetical protein
VHGAKNPVENGFKVIHHNRWDKNPSMRDFALKHGGDYIIRVRAAGRVPTRRQVIESAKGFLDHRMNEQMQKNPKGEKWHREQLVRDSKHFETDRMYEYGPPRLKLSTNLGGQPRVVDEYDVPNAVSKPGIFETRAQMSTIPRAGIKIEYGYSIPKELENFWMQGHDNFSRPELLIDWVELEGPIYSTWPPLSHQLVLFESPVQNSSERSYARDVLARFMKRAYRRPVSDAEIDVKLALYDLVRNDSASFVEAIKTPLSAVLVSPHFLYLAEPESDAILAALPTPKKLPSEVTLARLAAVSPRFQQSGGASTPAADSSDKKPARLSNSFRRYRDSQGRQFSGRLISLKGTTVRMEVTGRGLIGIPLARFSKTDRAYIRALAAKAAAATPKPATPAPKPSTPKPATPTTPVRPTSPGTASPGSPARRLVG